MKCENCIFYTPVKTHTSKDTLERIHEEVVAPAMCHRYPPTSMGFASPNKDNWCGEFVAKASEAGGIIANALDLEKFTESTMPAEESEKSG